MSYQAVYIIYMMYVYIIYMMYVYIIYMMYVYIIYMMYIVIAGSCTTPIVCLGQLGDNKGCQIF